MPSTICFMSWFSCCSASPRFSESCRPRVSSSVSASRPRMISSISSTVANWMLPCSTRFASFSPKECMCCCRSSISTISSCFTVRRSASSVWALKIASSRLVIWSWRSRTFCSSPLSTSWAAAALMISSRSKSSMFSSCCVASSSASLRSCFAVSSSASTCFSCSSARSRSRSSCSSCRFAESRRAAAAETSLVSFWAALLAAVVSSAWVATSPCIACSLRSSSSASLVMRVVKSVSCEAARCASTSLLTVASCCTERSCASPSVASSLDLLSLRDLSSACMAASRASCFEASWCVPSLLAVAVARVSTSASRSLPEASALLARVWTSRSSASMRSIQRSRSPFFSSSLAAEVRSISSHVFARSSS
mmetsp:Transcript_43767/g.135602  ORF Transcript_43767/g.135602 Transcript_43767/m.135602 type:complete len:366 (+) Transcript_43767:196-1293(+)